MKALDEGHFNENGVECIEDAVKVLLQGLGEDTNREGIRKTPYRVAKALREATKGQSLCQSDPETSFVIYGELLTLGFITVWNMNNLLRFFIRAGVSYSIMIPRVESNVSLNEGYKQKVNDVIHGALFPEAGLEGGSGQAGGAGGLVIVRDLDLFSYCESCLLPFQVQCHVGYVPSGKRVIGLSKLSRVADIFAKRLQDPQRLADEICTSLQHGIKPTGVAVVLQCLHIHYPKVESALPDTSHQGWVKILVNSGSGAFKEEKADIWTDFFRLLNFRGIGKENAYPGVAHQSWCPSQSCNKLEQSNLAMTNAVVSILRSLGEDPSRKDLVGTPCRFLKWLMNFRNSNLEMKLNGFLRGKINNPSPRCKVGNTEDLICSEFSLPFWSQCEHHLLPFQGVVHIGYYSSDGLDAVGRTILQSVVHFYGFKLQVQERLTRQIAETTSSLLGEDIMVVVEASHTCMISRGIEKFGSSTATIAVLGRFSSDPAVRAEFLQTLPNFCSA